MLKVTQIHQNKALARSTDDVYASANIEHVFENDEARDDTVQIQAETTPYSLTTTVAQGAVSTAFLKETTVSAIELLKHDINASLDEAHVAGHADPETLTGLATLWARELLSALAQSLHGMNADDRSEALSSLRPTATPTEPDHFWVVLRAILFAYFGKFSEDGWEPAVGCLPEPPGPAMAVWRTPDDEFVCDLLTLMTPWDSDEAIWNHVEVAMDAAIDWYGYRLSGLRVIAPLAGYLARWYHPDGSWEPMFDYPTFDDEAVS